MPDRSIEERLVGLNAIPSFAEMFLDFSLDSERVYRHGFLREQSDIGDSLAKKFFEEISVFKASSGQSSEIVEILFIALPPRVRTLDWAQRSVHDDDPIIGTPLLQASGFSGEVAMVSWRIQRGNLVIIISFHE